MCGCTTTNIKELSNKGLLYVHIATVRRIVNLFDMSGDVAPVSYNPGPKCMLAEPEDLEYTVSGLIELLMANTGIYLDELQQKLYQNI